MSLSYRSVLNARKFKCLKNVLIGKPKSIHLQRSLAAQVSFNLSDIGEGIREVVVKEWFVKEGDKVAQFDNICEVQSDKASVTITSRYDGVVTKLHHNIDDIALVGNPLVDIETGEADSKPSKERKDHSLPKDSVEPTVVTQQTGNGEKARINFQRPQNNTTLNAKANLQDVSTTLAIPKVRKLAKDNKINLGTVQGTGKEGRILSEDVMKLLQQPVSALESGIRSTRIEPIKGFQKVMVRTMNESLKIPHFVYSDEIKVTALSKLRKELKTKENISVSFLPFFVKAVSNALVKYPVLNSSVDNECENIIYHPTNNIGIAMDTKVGLAVPVIKNAEHLSVMEIAAELKRLLVSGKEGNFSPNDLGGGTFTVSNIGSIGGTYTKPVILPPQVAILAVGRGQVLPRFDENGNVFAEEVLNISGAADHRIVDGATMAKFTNSVKRQLETPHLLFLNL